MCGMMGDMRVLNARYLIEGLLMFFIFFSIYMYSRETLSLPEEEKEDNTDI